jgi:antitoxin (DNA-binding transcriptional repressor) of toxin-antitoxin stability system
MGRRATSTVGVRKLKAQLSGYLRKVKAGETVTITERGKVVAELRAPAKPSGRGEAYDWMVATGQIIPAKKKLNLRAWLRSLDKLPKFPKGTAQKWLDEDREERF